jgi:DNA-binding NtrC family response regulator
MSGEILAGRRVIVIDDEPAQAEALAELLRLEGMDATWDSVPAQAVQRCLSAPPEVVVVDLSMPGMTGAEVLAAVRARYPQLPAVLLTGCPQSDPVVSALVPAGIAYIPKPVDMPRLLAALEAVQYG